MADIRILLVYPNERDMSLVPPVFGLFAALLRREGHIVDFFDSTILIQSPNVYSNNHNYFKNKRTITVYVETLQADNYTYLDGSYSTSYMDRSYNQDRLKCSFSQIISKGKAFGSILEIFNRKISYQKVKIDSSFPNYIVENKEKLKDWIL